MLYEDIVKTNTFKQRRSTVVVVCNKAFAADGLTVHTSLEFLAKFHENMGMIIIGQHSYLSYIINF